ncbi:MAG: ATP-binding protein, partial [Phycisphaerae bacterium]
METIQATVNPRLLRKANRLFTGSLSGRIIEILQNARRAGATKVEIQNHDGLVTVRDHGQGIVDFARLLDLGGSGWQELESSEDPAGVGLFCLAPRRVAIRSQGKMA